MCIFLRASNAAGGNTKGKIKKKKLGMNQDLGPVWKKRVSSTYYSELRGSIQQDKPRNHHPLEQQQPKNEGSL
jgi:hypothetical protein